MQVNNVKMSPGDLYKIKKHHLPQILWLLETTFLQIDLPIIIKASEYYWSSAHENLMGSIYMRRYLNSRNINVDRIRIPAVKHSLTQPILIFIKKYTLCPKHTHYDYSEYFLFFYDGMCSFEYSKKTGFFIFVRSMIDRLLESYSYDGNQ